MGIVVVLGGLITDLVANAPRLPFAGESLIGSDFSTFLGGKGINQAIAAKRMGATVALIGRVGTDSLGDAFFPVLATEGIDSTYVERDTVIGSGVSILTIAEESSQSASIAIPRANLAIPVETVITAIRSVLQQRTNFDEIAIFLAQCETSRVSYLTGLQHARALGMTTILNATPIPREALGDDLFALVDILIVNEVEAAALAQMRVTELGSAQIAAEALLARGPQHVIIMLGVQGCLWSMREQWHEALTTPSHHVVPAFTIKPTDPTATGDAFCGVLAACLASGLSMDAALQRASAAGAITAARKGAISSLPTAAEVEETLEKA